LSRPRIISGTARGIRLSPVPGDITRPITDRVKEALFNIIAFDIQGASFLDLFGGTGSVGIEALSRGAAFCQFVDLNNPAILTIKKNLKATKLEANASLVQMDSFSYLKQPPSRQFDYIFIAPPQYKKMWISALQELEKQPSWLSEDGWIIVQIDPIEEEKINLRNFVEIDRRVYGSTLLLIYQSPLPDSPSS
jgi:16S rRNA (guanine(966)-N(2))-methyltransferase RsmD